MFFISPALLIISTYICFPNSYYILFLYSMYIFIVMLFSASSCSSSTSFVHWGANYEQWQHTKLEWVYYTFAEWTLTKNQPRISISYWSGTPLKSPYLVPWKYRYIIVSPLKYIIIHATICFGGKKEIFCFYLQIRTVTVTVGLYHFKCYRITQDLFPVTIEAHEDSKPCDLTVFLSQELLPSVVLQICLKSQTPIVSKDSPDVAHSHTADFTCITHHIWYDEYIIFPTHCLCIIKLDCVRTELE